MRLALTLIAVLAPLTACGGDGDAAKTAPAVVWAVGDGGTGGAPAKALAQRIAEDQPARLLYLGDVYPEGTAEDFAKRYETVYGELKSVTEPTPGNHEWGNREEGYIPYWTKARGRPPRSAYAFDLGGWQIISLNSEDDVGPASEQVRYVQSLRDREGTCRLAFWHSPRFSAGEHGDDDDLEPVWNALTGKATLVLSAHDHNTQRWKPRDGITQIVAGAGGANLYDVDEDRPGLAFANDTDFAGVRLTLRPGRADYAVMTADGRTLDRGQVTCRPLAPAR